MRSSLEEQLLHSSLLCGLKPAGNPAYRLQLFFIANKELGSKSHQSDFQKALQTGVVNNYWIKYGERGSGDYLFTESGYNLAKQIYGVIIPIYPPASGNQYHTLIKGEINNLLIEIETIGHGKKSTTVFINHEPIKSSKEACKIIEQNSHIILPTTGESSARVLYNLAIYNEFELIWKGEY